MISLHYNVNLGIVTNIITSSLLQCIDSSALLLAYLLCCQHHCILQQSHIRMKILGLVTADTAHKIFRSFHLSWF